MLDLQQFKGRPVIVTGGREFKDEAMLVRVLGALNPAAVAHGNARGADRLAGAWAWKRGKPEIKLDANWPFYDRAAGPTRNGWLLDYIGGAEGYYVLAFPGGEGTADMIEQARDREFAVVKAEDVLEAVRRALHAH